MARDNGEDLHANLKASVGAASTLTRAMTGVSNSMTASAAAAGVLAANIAKASASARIAASATGIGAIAAVLVTIAGVAIGVRDRIKQVAESTKEIGRETAVLQRLAAGDTRAAKELEIVHAMDDELKAASKLEGRFVNISKLQDAIRAKAQAARDVLAGDIKRRFDQGEDALVGETIVLQKSLEGFEARRRAEINQRRIQALQDIDPAFSKEQVEQRVRTIGALYDAELDVLAHELQQPARDLGASIASAIADGIAEGVRTGSIGEGLKSLGGGVIVAIGEMMQRVGTQGLLASSLIAKLMAVIGTPAGIPASLALIAAGAVVRGFGQSLTSGGRSGRGGGGRSGGGSFGGGGTIIHHGLVNPLNPLPTVAAQTPVVFSPTIIGVNDAKAQREIYTMWDQFRLRLGKV